MRKGIATIIALIGFFAFASDARAQQAITSGTPGFEQVQRGVASIGIENMLLVHSNSASDPSTPDADRSTLYASYTGALTFRYFLMTNLALGVSLGVHYQLNQDTVSTSTTETTNETSDLGFIGFLTANYYVRLGYGLFFNPGLGLGGLYATRTIPDSAGGSTATQVSVYGGAVRVDLGFTFFAGRHFSLHAGPQIVMRIGAQEVAADAGVEASSSSFFTVDAGFEVGLAYAF